MRLHNIISNEECIYFRVRNLINWKNTDYNDNNPSEICMPVVQARQRGIIRCGVINNSKHLSTISANSVANI